MKEPFLVRLINKIDSRIKFPNLRKGETGIQVGFDLSSPNLTTDLLKMHYSVGNKGLVIGVDPDPENHKKMQKVIDERNLNIKLIHKATFSETTSDKLLLGKKSSFNRIVRVDSDQKLSSTATDFVEVSLDTLDNIIEEQNIDWRKIAHISLTNNGAEYDTLKGMERLLSLDNLSLTVTAGRKGKFGEIEGKRDYEVIVKHLESKGFKCKFMRMNQSFYWGFIHRLLIKRKWIFGKKQYGVIMAAKGNKRIRWYQSFS